MSSNEGLHPLLEWLSATLAAKHGGEKVTISSFSDLLDGKHLLEVARDCMPGFEPEDSSTELAVAKEMLSEFYQRPVEELSEDGSTGVSTSFGMYGLVAALLGCCVQSSSKEDHIRTIMSFDEESQAELMHIIEEVMSKFPTAHETESALTPVRSPFAGICTPSTGKKPKKTLVLENRILKEEVTDMKEEIQSLKRQLTVAQNAAEARQGPSSSSTVARDAMHAEESSREVMELQSMLSAKSSQISKLQSEVAKLSVDARDTAALRDELDMLRPLGASAAKADALAEKCRNQASSIADLTQQIKDLETQTRDLVSKNVELQHQVDRVPALRKQLESYKDSKHNAEVRASDLEMESQQLAKEVEMLREQLRKSEEALGRSSSEGPGASSLADLLPYEPAAGSAVGCGISEFNPELAEKLARLEAENSRLREAALGQASEKVTMLVSELEDANRMRATFESKYKNAAARAADLEASWKRTKADLAALQATFKDTKSTLEARIKVAETEVTSLQGEIRSCTDQLEGTETKLGASIARAASLEKDLEQCRAEYDAHTVESQERILRKNQELDDITCSKNEALQDLEACRQELAETQGRLRQATEHLEKAERVGKRLQVEKEEQIAAATSAIKAKDDELVSLRSRSKSLEAKLASASQANEDARKSLVDAQARFALKEQQLNDDLKSITKRHKEMEADLTAKYEESKAELQAAQEKRLLAEGCLTREKKYSTELLKQIQDLQASREEDARNAEEKDTMIKRLRDSLGNPSAGFPTFSASQVSTGSPSGSLKQSTGLGKSASGTGRTRLPRPSRVRTTTTAASSMDDDESYAEVIARLEEENRKLKERDQTAVMRETGAMSQKHELKKENDRLLAKLEEMKEEMTKLQLELMRAEERAGISSARGSRSMSAKPPKGVEARVPKATEENKPASTAMAANDSFASSRLAPDEPADEWTAGSSSSMSRLTAKRATGAASSRITVSGRPVATFKRPSLYAGGKGGRQALQQLADSSKRRTMSKIL